MKSDPRATPTGRHRAPASPSATLDSPPPAIPDHELLKKIGDGSYGEVWLARNAVGTLRAIKIVHRKTFWSDHPFEREFKGIQKFEPISRSHEGLVDVLQIGRGDGYFYYVMELADSSESVISEPVISMTAEKLDRANTGSLNTDLLITEYSPRTLTTDLTRHRRLPPAECIRIGLALTDALAHLHRHGLVHRDIKPANIIFVSGVPKLADIGLVAEVSEARSYVGTEGFIPPEGPGTPQADLYSLGKLLYEISTGQDRHAFPALPPDLFTESEHIQSRSSRREEAHFEFGTRSAERGNNQSLLTSAATNPGEPPDLVQQAELKQLVELNAILLKACQPDPRARYGSAEEMLAELELLQRGQSVKARRSAKRRFAAARTTCIAACVVIAISVIGIPLMKRAFVPPNEKSLLRKLNGQEKRPFSKGGTVNQQANNFVNQGDKHRQKGTRAAFAEAIECYNRAAMLDPNYSMAHVGLAVAYCDAADWFLSPNFALAQAKQEAERALAIDETVSQAHVVMGKVKMYYDRDWRGAEKEFQRAIELNTNNASAHTCYAIFLEIAGRTAEALPHEKFSQRLAPNALHIQMDGLWRLYRDSQYESVVEKCLAMIEQDPNYFGTHFLLGLTYRQQGKFEQAMAEIQKVRAIDDEPRMVALQGHLHGLMGKRDEALQCLDELEKQSKILYVSPYLKAIIHVGLGDKEQTFQWLNQACEQPGWLVTELSTDLIWDTLRSDPEFQKLLKRIGLQK